MQDQLVELVGPHCACSWSVGFVLLIACERRECLLARGSAAAGFGIRRASGRVAAASFAGVTESVVLSIAGVAGTGRRSPVSGSSRRWPWSTRRAYGGATLAGSRTRR
jgi:hypothetical protein